MLRYDAGSTLSGLQSGNAVWNSTLALRAVDDEIHEIS